MDATHFDRLVRSLSHAGSRRGLLGVFSALPLLSGLAALLGEDESAAKGRRKRRKKAHKHGRPRTHGNHKHKKKHKKHCQAESPEQTCAGACGEVVNNCQQTVECGACVCDPPCAACQTCDNGQCVDCAAAGAICCVDACVSGVCCTGAECAPNGDTCVGHQCECGGGSACAGDPALCCGGACVDTDTDANNCGACGQLCSGSTPVCWDGECVCGDVCAAGCQFTSVQDAIDDLPAESTIRICAGAYGAIAVDKSLTLIGAGDGDDPGNDTILDAGGSGLVAAVANGVTATFQGLRITGGSAGGVANNGTLTLTACTVTENETGSVGGGIANFGAVVTLNDTHVSFNTADEGGGGIYNNSTAILNDSSVAENTGKNGGGIVNQGDLTLNGASSVTGNETTSNTDGSGGGIINNGTAALNDTSSVSGNQIHGLLNSGGGIFNNLGCTLNLNDTSRVSGNQAGATASNPGAGVFNNTFQASSGTVNASATSLICGNTPDQCVGFGNPNGICQASCPN